MTSFTQTPTPYNLSPARILLLETLESDPAHRLTQKTKLAIGKRPMRLNHALRVFTSLGKPSNPWGLDSVTSWLDRLAQTQSATCSPPPKGSKA